MNEKIALAGASLVGGIWMVAALYSQEPILQALLLVALQVLLAFTALLIGARALHKPSTPEGPGVLFFLAMHVLIYYGLANVVPALLPEMRPWYMEAIIGNRIPPSNMTSYILGTLAALSMLCGLALGAWIVRELTPMRVPARTNHLRKYRWLPRYRLSMLGCGATLILLLLGTAVYGVTYSSVILSDDEIASLSLVQQIFFHSLLGCLSVAPVLAAGAYAQASSTGQQKMARWATALSLLATVTALAIWRMRSHAIIAVVLPFALFSYAGIVHWRRLLIPGFAIIGMIYLGVTFVRVTGVEDLMNPLNRIEEVGVKDAFSSVFEESGSRLVGEMAIGDASYRTAGLEGVAALIQAQQNVELELQWGGTIYSGFLQALPSSLRSMPEIPELIKTAPYHFDIFSSGDWVTTLLAEFVLDFGFLMVFFPALFFGGLLCMVDRVLLGFGQIPAFEGFLALRIPFLLFIVSNGGSISEMTLKFFKATIGYGLLLLFITWASRISGWNPSDQDAYSNHDL